MHRQSIDLQRLLHVVEWAIDGGIKQFSTDLGVLFEPGPREPVWDVLHLRFDYQPDVIGMQNSGTNILGMYQQGTRQVLRLLRRSPLPVPRLVSSRTIFGLPFSYVSTSFGLSYLQNPHTLLFLSRFTPRHQDTKVTLDYSGRLGRTR